jgi:UDP-3-O-[3-hydroxymyristoyl] glucosamine N-acyltransferase
MIALKKIIDFLGSDIINVFGNIENVYIKYLRPTDTVDKDTLDWIGLAKQDRQQVAEQSKAYVILCDPSVTYSEIIKLQKKILIHVNNPKMAVAQVANQFLVSKPFVGINSSSFIHPEAKISSSVYIGPNCSIGNSSIGENTQIYPNVTIYDNVHIGNNVIIQAGAVIGTDGLGCERTKEGILIKFPHFGGVEIGNNVEIGANCQIAKGALSNTIIGNGCKVNGLCVIAHNCILGKNVWISFSTTIAGSTRIADNVTIYSNVVVREQLTIGTDVKIGMGSVVTKNIPSGETWIGNPAKKIEKKIEK